LLVLGVTLLVLSGVLVWWLASQPSAVQYRTATVTRGPVVRTVAATGTVNPVLTIIVGSYVSGVISDMYCDFNTQVKKGQLCAKIDPRPYKAALDQAKGQLSRDVAQLEGARLNLTRYHVLNGQDSIAKQTYDDQLALVHQLTGTVQIDRAAVETAQVNLDYTNIISPVDGTVVARNITIGQTVAASFQTPTLFLIATDLTRMQVDTNVSESDIGAVKLGDDASFTVEAFADRPFQGKVAQVRQAPQTVQNVVTYDVVVAADNADFLLKPGMTATVGIVTERRTDAVRIPDQALRFVPTAQRPTGPGGAAVQTTSTQPGAAPDSSRPTHSTREERVWVLGNGKPTPIAVTAGLDDDTYTEIVQGDLKPGDSIIVGEQRTDSGQHASSFHFGL
jgi:HlyD family secretion protein